MSLQARFGGVAAVAIVALIYGLVSRPDHDADVATVSLQLDSPALTDGGEGIFLSNTAGVVYESFSSEFVIPANGARTVKSIRSSCGCAAVNIDVGDEIPANGKLLVRVNLERAKAGAGKQHVVVEWADESVYTFAVSYLYHSPPFLDPEQVVFHPHSPAKQVLVRFPGSRDGKLTDVRIDNMFVSCKPEQSEDESEVIRLMLSVDYDTLTEAQSGFVTLKTNSTRRPILRIPFLALLN